MLKRRIFAFAAPILGQIKVRAAAAKAYCDALEARVSAQRLVISDVFGADAFVARSSATEVSQRAARWDEGIQFEPSRRDGSDDDLASAPAFLTQPRAERIDDQPDGVARYYRGTLPMLVCTGLLLTAWISTGRSGPMASPVPSAADALAEQFSGSDEGSVRSGIEVATVFPRLEFAPRFAVFYADLLSKDGVCGDGDALDTIESAASIMIRNLPAGTVLSAGEQVSATAWRLKPEDVKAIVMKIPADHSVPIQAKIETLDPTGAVLGKMAVEVRETQKEQVAVGAGQRKIVREAPSKQATAKRRPTAGAAQQAAKKYGAIGEAAPPQPAKPAQQQLLGQLPFLPGPYDKNAQQGTSVGQQILINLGVIPAPPVSAALTQNN